MANKQVTVTLVGDSDQFVKSMAMAHTATRSLETSTEDLGHRVGDAQKQIKGTGTLLNGLTEVFGGNVEAVTETLHGYATLAKGIKTGLIPAMKQGTTAIKAMSTSLLATPWGRIAAGAVLVGGVFLATSHDADELNTAMVKVKWAAGEVAEGWRRIGSATLGFFGFEPTRKVTEWGYALEDTGYNMNVVQEAADTLGSRGAAAADTFGAAIARAQASAERLAKWGLEAAKAIMAVQIAGQLGGTVDDPDGAFASAAAVAQMNNVMSGPIISAVEKSAKPKVKKAAKTLGDTFADEFRSALAKRSPLQVLEDALSKWQAKLQKAKDFQKSTKSLFELAFSGDRDQFGSSVGGIRDQVKRFQDFIKVIGQLRKKHLDESFLRTMIDAGPSSLEALQTINSSSVGDMNKLIHQAEGLAGGFSADETARRGMDLHPQPVKVTLDVKGGDKELVNLIKKWVRTNGGGDVQVAFGKR